MANEEQARFWAEDGGPRWIEEEQDHDVMLEPFGAAVLAALDPQPGEHVLDVGCGFGTTALAVARAVGPSGRAVGVDIAEPMVARARARAEAEGIRQLEVFRADAQTDDLGGPYDAVVSRFGVMFFADPGAAMANLLSATRPGGRLAFVCWRPMADNPWYSLPNSLVLAALPDPPEPPPPLAPGPFGFDDASVVSDLLILAGWQDVGVARFDADVALSGRSGLDGALDRVQSSSTARLLPVQLPEARVAQVLDDVRAVLARYERDGEVRLPASVWLMTARRP